MLYDYMARDTERVPKSKFKGRALHYFRVVEKTHKPVVITDRGKAVLKVVPYSENPEDVLTELRGSLLKYVHPTSPAGESEWEVAG